MNHYPSREQVQALRERYPPGTMIQLTADMQGERFQAGDIGKVTSIDDAGQIHLVWQKGGSLAIIPGVDSFREIEPLALNPYLDKGNLRINGYYVDACTDNGIERADTLGKIEINEGTLILFQLLNFFLLDGNQAVCRGKFATQSIKNTLLILNWWNREMDIQEILGIQPQSGSSDSWTV